MPCSIYPAAFMSIIKAAIPHLLQIVSVEPASRDQEEVLTCPNSTSWHINLTHLAYPLCHFWNREVQVCNSNFYYVLRYRSKSCGPWNWPKRLHKYNQLNFSSSLWILSKHYQLNPDETFPDDTEYNNDLGPYIRWSQKSLSFSSSLSSHIFEQGHMPLSSAWTIEQGRHVERDQEALREKGASCQ